MFVCVYVCGLLLLRVCDILAWVLVCVGGCAGDGGGRGSILCVVMAGCVFLGRVCVSL